MMIIVNIQKKTNEETNTVNAVLKYVLKRLDNNPVYTGAIPSSEDSKEIVFKIHLLSYRQQNKQSIIQEIINLGINTDRIQVNKKNFVLLNKLKNFFLGNTING